MFQQILGTIGEYWQSGLLFVACLLLLSYLQRRYHNRVNEKRAQTDHKKNPQPRHLKTVFTRYNNDRMDV